MRHLRTLFFVFIVTYGVYGFANDADRDESGIIVSEGEIDAFAMRVGDCFDDSPELTDASIEVQDVAGLPCSEPHDNEVYAMFDVSLDAFPGDESMFDLSTDACLKRFKSFVGKSYDESILDLFAIYPTAESWSQVNDREVICAVYRVDYKKMTGSSKSSGI